MTAAGGTVWFGDETALREFPPLRAAWAKQGTQAVVVISGRNRRRVLHGALEVRTGAFVQVVRERNRGPDAVGLVEAVGAQRDGKRTLLVWDNAPSHRTRVVREAAVTAGVELAYLPFRSPELNPCEDLWRPMKRQVAANRAYPTMDELTARAMAWLEASTPEDRLRAAGLRSHKFQWLPT